MRVAVLDDYQGVALTSADWAPVREHGEIEVFRDHLAGEDAVAARLAGFDVVVAMRERTPFPASLLRRLPGLRLLVTTGMRNASIDVEAARELGITVCGTGGNAAATPELTWGLLLSLARGIPAEQAGVRAGGWQRGVGFTLEGTTLGLLGLGTIGRRVARYAQAFGMPVLAWSQNLTPEDAEAHGARYVGKETLFTESTVVSIHLKLSDRTRNLVTARELSLLGPAGYLINTSRGPIVNEPDLITALSESRIAGAALDVFDVEPLPADHPLRTRPNALLTPHIGYVTRETYALFYGEAVENILRWRSGSPVREL